MAVGHREATINGTLQDTKDTSTSGGGGKANIKVRAEGAGTVFLSSKNNTNGDY